MMLELPPGIGVRTEAQKAAYDTGYRVEGSPNGPWLEYRSTSAPGGIWIGATSQQGPWFVSIEHTGVAAELRAIATQNVNGPGVAALSVPNTADLHHLLDRIYRLSISLPDAPLARFRKATERMPAATEVERMVKQRVGQDIFRDALMSYWNARCPLTGITEPALLRASHIVAWSDCDSDEHRLDVHNGLLLSALWDAAFDRGLVSFSDDGKPLASPNLSAAARTVLSFDQVPLLTGLKDAHRANLSRHRARHSY